MMNATLDLLIVALCRDFERRRCAIEGALFGKRTLMEYRYINCKMLDAAAEIVGEHQARRFISEIGNRVGYAKCSDSYMSEAAYKRYKAEVKRNIALKLHLTE